MAKKQEISAHEAASHLKELKALFELLAKNDVNKGDSGFSADKEAILKVFEHTKNEIKEDILVRLTLIDSMYSTQMSRRCYALDELADFLAKLSEGKQGKLRQMFLDFAKDPDNNLSLFNSTFKERNEKGELIEVEKNLFSEAYGIGKDGKDKGVAISLISKYAYFETDFQFPIYDSIACEMHPLVWHFCGFGKAKPELLVKNGTNVDGEKTMVAYVKAINLLIDKLDCKGLNYDLLDRVLWFVGKIRRGNLSLVLTREEYQETMTLYPPQEITKVSRGKEKTITEYFNVENVDLAKLEYLKTNKILKAFFELAKFYGHKK